MIPDTVEDSSHVTVKVSGYLTHLCPHVDEVDQGRVDIEWRVEGRTFELHSLAEYLRGFSNSVISHEGITDRIRHDLGAVEGLTILSVRSSWQTGGLYVAVDSLDLPG